MWDSHTGVTAVPSTTLDGGARARKGDAYANSVVIGGFSSKVPTKASARGLAEVATIPSSGDGPGGGLAAQRDQLSRRDHRYHRDQCHDRGVRSGRAEPGQ